MAVTAIADGTVTPVVNGVNYSFSDLVKYLIFFNDNGVTETGIVQERITFGDILSGAQHLPIVVLVSPCAVYVGHFTLGTESSASRYFVVDSTTGSLQCLAVVNNESQLPVVKQVIDPVHPIYP